MINFLDKFESKNFNKFLENFLPRDAKFEERNLDTSQSFIDFKNAKIIASSNKLNNLKVIEITLESSRDKRVSNSRDIFRLLSKFSIDNALVVSIFKTGEYRFSFIKTSYNWESDVTVKKNYTNPRRLSFFLGPGSKIHTPTQRLLKKGRVKDINDLYDRFNIEVLSEEFYKNYRLLYDKLVTHIKADKTINSITKRLNISRKMLSTKVMNQILFCYFIQKKGWLGATKNNHLYQGDKNFLRAKFNEYKDKNFYNEFLEFLFYDGFNKKNQNDYLKKIKCKVPFLNGGLYSPLQGYDWKRETLLIPNQIFSNSDSNGILDVFDLYNFTINESDPLDKEVGIDPEMLGKVFERLIDINGVVYTPKIVVDYMCETVIGKYLKNIKNIKLSDETIDRFLKCSTINSDTQLFLEIKNIYKELDEALKQVRVIDPAVGSGQFTTGMLSLISNLRLKLNVFFQNNRSLFQLKKYSIQNNIYGIDIIGSSVEIARLRLWLSLIVDEEKIENISSLPNLDYKIYNCNSLIKSEINLLSRAQIDEFNEMKSKLNEDLSSISKSELKIKIEKKLKEIIKLNDGVGIEIIFNEVFSNSNRGFDIVIGNPPYISALDKKRSKNEKDYNKKIYPEATGNYDEFLLFLLRAYHLLKQNGIYSWIIKNSFLNSDYSTSAKNKMIKTGGLLNSIDISNIEVFKNVGVYPIIITGALSSKEKFIEYSANSLEDLEQDKIKKISSIKKYLFIKDFEIKIFSGTTGYTAETVKKLISEDNGKNRIPFLVSGNVDRYKFNNQNVTYLKKNFKKAYIELNEKILAEQKINFYKSPKIVIAGMTKNIEAVYIEKPVGLGVGIYGIYSFGKYDPYFLTGLLNSEFYSQYLKSAFKDKHLQGGYISINKSVIERLPFDYFDKKIEQYISDRSKLLHEFYKYNNDDEGYAFNLEKEINMKINNFFQKK